VSSLSNVATYACVSDTAYRIMKHLIPGPYTFLFPATKLVPRLVQNPKRKTTGSAKPYSVLGFVGYVGESDYFYFGSPSQNERPLSVEIESNISRVELFDRLDKVVDVIVDNGSEPGYQVSTILDLTGEEPIITRRGLGWEEAAAWAAG